MSTIGYPLNHREITLELHYLLPEARVHGPFSLRGLKVNLRWRNSLMILGTLHHQGSMRGLKMDLGRMWWR